MFFKMFKMHMSRMLHLKRFYLSIISVAAICLLSVMNEIQGAGSIVLSAYYLTNIRHGIGAYFIAMSIVIVLPYSLFYWEDRETHYRYEIAGRCTRRSYCWSGVLATAVSAMLTVFSGYLLFYLILRIRGPILRPDELESLIELAASNNLTVFEKLLLGRFPFAYFLTVFLTEAVSYSFLAVITLMSSALIHNVYVLLCIPLIVYQGWDFLQTALGLPGILRWNYILQSGGYLAHITRDIRQYIFLLLLYFGVLILTAGFVFRKWVEKEFSDE